MISRGPSRINGAWTLHLRFNEAVHVPDELDKNMGMSTKSWLLKTLANHLATKLLKNYKIASKEREATEEHRDEAYALSKSFLAGSGSFENFLWSQTSNFVKWLACTPEIHPSDRRLVTAVQRQARSGDRVVAVRHPITQATPVMSLKVDATKRGFALGIPPMFINLSEGDYDGDKMKIAAETAPLRRAIWERCLSPSKLMHNPLGRRIVKLSGVAPLALNLAQNGGVLYTDPYSTLQGSGCPLWRGVLEPTFRLDVLTQTLASIGCARPDMLAQCWSQPQFQELCFEVQRQDGTWCSSLELNVSHDGFFHVPRNLSANMQQGWIAAELTRRKHLLKVQLEYPLKIKLVEASRRESALDDLTFAQMRSLVQAFTPKNFHKGQGDTIMVQHLPGLVQHGNFQTFVVQELSPWHRMTRVLLRLAARPRTDPQPHLRAKGPPPKRISGRDAVLAEMRYCSWRPSEKDVVACMLELDKTTEKGLLETIYRDTDGAGRVVDLSLALQDRQGICALILEHELFDKCSDHAGFTKAAQTLRRFAFEHSSPAHRKLKDSEPLDIDEAKELWRQLDLSELLRICTEPHDSEGAHADGGPLRLVFKTGRMQDADWQRLMEDAPRVRRRLHKALPLVKLRASRRMYTLRDWGRMVGAMTTPRRQTLDVESSLESLMSLWNDDAEYCATLSALDALGHDVGNLLNQPTQNEVVTLSKHITQSLCLNP
jgi:hypothetical protein